MLNIVHRTRRIRCKEKQYSCESVHSYNCQLLHTMIELFYWHNILPLLTHSHNHQVFLRHHDKP
ncbi:unnamed protein product [Schistosoma curassoni]|uniref:Ovule protein n=1 Tax=Schistosoma curassoni TaxID=6186 RepID=A0A183L0E7_9TREM|nr:unnamed protein product [Schistosoma curassoni]